MGLTDFIKNLFGNQQKTNGKENWIRDTLVLQGSSYKVDEDGWITAAGDVYQSDYVNNAIDRVASEIAKIDVRSVVVTEDEVKVQNDDITRLFRFGPNPIQTTADFLSSTEWIRRKYNNVFIFPSYEWVIDRLGQRHKRFTAFWVLKPTDFEVGTDASGNIWEIKFIYSDGNTYILPYADLIHLKWRRGTNLYKGGGNDNGQPDTTDLLKSVSALNSTIEGLPRAIASSLQVKGVYNAKSLLDASRQAEQRANFEQHILDSKMGMIVTDLAGEFTPVNMVQPTIGDGLVRFMKSGITQRFGISDAILSGDYSSSQHSSFYQTAIEEFIVEFEQEFSRKCFTQREQDVGHRIRGYYNQLLYMATNEKQEMARLAFNVGLMTINDVRSMWGLPPIPDGNKRMQSLNYVDVDIANAYQMNQSHATGGDLPDMTPDQPTDDDPGDEGDMGNEI